MSLIINTSAIDAVNNGTDIKTNVKLSNIIVARLKYHSTNAWRGYWDAEPVKKHGWTKLDSDWITGDWDDAPEGHASSDVESKLKALAKQYAKTHQDVLVIYTPTSNVFSSSYDVLVSKVNNIARRKKIDNNTYLLEYPDHKAIRLHDTEILIERDGKITLNNGGWDTMTTRARINKYLPFGYSVYRVKGETRMNNIKYTNGMKIEGALQI